MEASKVKKLPPYVQTAEDLLAMDITEVPVLLRPILPKVGIAALCGSSDTGKSYFCLHLALALCSDVPSFVGHAIKAEHKSVIVVCTEDSKEDVCVRLKALQSIGKLDTKALRFIFDCEGIEEKLAKELSRQPADLVILDTFGDLFTGNLNQSIEVRRFLRPYKALAQEHKCLFLFNHHIGKGKEKNLEPSKNDVLGSQAIESACRTVLMLKKGVGNKRTLTVVKGNNIPEELKNNGKILEFDLISGFQDTGKSTAQEETKQEKEEALATLVKKLYPEQGSYTKVAAKLKVMGYEKIDKNKVGQLLKKYNPSVPVPEEKDDGRGKAGNLRPAKNPVMNYIWKILQKGMRRNLLPPSSVPIQA